jgi:hypothetical protein
VRQFDHIVGLQHEEEMKHVLTLSEIATACNEYVVRKYYPVGTWHAKANVRSVHSSFGGEKADWKSDFSEGVIIGISIEVESHDDFDEISRLRGLGQ